MAIRTLKKKIGAAQKTKKLTKALENISTVKMNKFLRKVDNLKQYHQALEESIASLDMMNNPYTDRQLLDAPNLKNTKLIILISSDRGLCGSYNYKLFKHLISNIENKQHDEQQLEFLCIGKKGANFVLKTGLQLNALLLNVDREDYTKIANQIKNYLIEKYLTGQYAEIEVFYTHYESGIRQYPRHEKLLPMLQTKPPTKESALQSSEIPTYKLIEEDKNYLINHLLEDLMETTVAKCILEAVTSENIARASSMKNATDSAESLIDELTLYYNKSRQAAVTQEIMEIANSAQSA